VAETSPVSSPSPIVGLVEDQSLSASAVQALRRSCLLMNFSPCWCCCRSVSLVSQKSMISR